MNSALLFAALSILAAGPSVHANVLYRPPAIEAVNNIEKTAEFKMVFVPGAKVVWANYDLLRADFPELMWRNRRQIREWIAEEFSYVSQAQIAMGELRNTEIAHLPERTQIGFRQRSQARGGVPAGWRPVQGRGHLAKASLEDGRPIGLVDLKGSGVTDAGAILNKRLLNHYRRNGKSEDDFRVRTSTNGLMTLEEAMLEVAGSEVTERIFRAQKLPLRSGVIRSYFILEFPFRVKLDGERELPAALMARQAHVGRIWAGTNPLRGFTNIKQTDFFGAYTDAGTIRISLEGIGASFDRSLGRIGDLKLTFEPRVMEDHRRGDPAAIADYIERTVLNAESRLGLSPIIEAEYQEMDPRSAMREAARWIQLDPPKYWRMAEAFLHFAEHDPKFMRDREIQAAIKALLRQTWNDLENPEILDAPKSRRPRELGLLLTKYLRPKEKIELSEQDRDFIKSKTCEDVLKAGPQRAKGT